MSAYSIPRDPISPGATGITPTRERMNGPYAYTVQQSSPYAIPVAKPASVATRMPAGYVTGMAASALGTSVQAEPKVSSTQGSAASLPSYYSGAAVKPAGALPAAAASVQTYGFTAQRAAAGSPTIYRQEAAQGAMQPAYSLAAQPARVIAAPATLSSASTPAYEPVRISSQPSPLSPPKAASTSSTAFPFTATTISTRPAGVVPKSAYKVEAKTSYAISPPSTSLPMTVPATMTAAAVATSSQPPVMKYAVETVSPTPTAPVMAAPISLAGPVAAAPISPAPAESTSPVPASVFTYEAVAAPVETVPAVSVAAVPAINYEANAAPVSPERAAIYEAVLTPTPVSPEQAAIYEASLTPEVTSPQPLVSAVTLPPEAEEIIVSTVTAPQPVEEVIIPTATTEVVTEYEPVAAPVAAPVTYVEPAPEVVAPAYSVPVREVAAVPAPVYVEPVAVATESVMIEAPVAPVYVEPEPAVTQTVLVETRVYAEPVPAYTETRAVETPVFVEPTPVPEVVVPRSVEPLPEVVAPAFIAPVPQVVEQVFVEPSPPPSVENVYVQPAPAYYDQPSAMVTQTVVAEPAVAGYDFGAAAKGVVYERPVTETVYAQPAQAVPTAAVMVDVDHDGKADVIIQGVDMNRDGIPDALQQAPVEVPAAPTQTVAEELPVAEYHTLQPRSEYLVDNSELASSTWGLLYRDAKIIDGNGIVLLGTADDIAPWGRKVMGIDHRDGWLEVDRRFLPFFKDGKRVLSKTSEYPKQLFLIDNHAAELSTDGLGFRTSKVMAEVKNPPPGAVACWNTTVRGVPEGDWLRVGSRFLPMYVEGHPVIIHDVTLEEEEDEANSGKRAPLRSEMAEMVSERKFGGAGVVKYVVCNNQLQHTTMGVHYRTLKHAEDHTLKGDYDHIVPWGAVVWGSDHGDGWLECGNDRYLPFQLSGCKVLHNYAEVEDMLYRIDNSELGAETHGVGYRKSMNLEDKLSPGPGTMAYWNATVVGTLSEDKKWLSAGVYFLPVFLNGKCIVRKVEPSPTVPEKEISCFESMFSASSTQVATGPTEEYLVDNGQLRAASWGVHYRLLKDATDKDLAGREDSIVKWGTRVLGKDGGDGWLECAGNLFLPFAIDGHTVLHKVEDALGDLFLIDNSRLNHSTDGLGYRSKKNMASKLPPIPGSVAHWGTTVRGVQSGEWLKHGVHYLPMSVEGIPVVVKCT